ncbi:lysozyme [Streptomyces sp. AJS327]|uniref:GH25 family lysozyme n=1 Tax=Streptomyces sp. AJS327 TaxID=2545265 RepID=UPI0015DDDC88|nr:GH25 family lysozyme [Streptomyces sp. AJS327]MBA0050637.1 lysozyme [Streptomyces sp. AJS327]
MRRPTPHHGFYARRVATATGVVGAAVALTLSTAATSLAAPPVEEKGEKGEYQLGEGYMGISAQQELAGKEQRQVGPKDTSGVQGIDVSHYQGSINWGSVKGDGIQFAWIKATEGTTYKDPKFSANYTGAYNNKVIRGAYHFARPASSSGSAQADFFAKNGGAWSADNLTLPGVLDIENGSSSQCHGVGQAAMRTWINDFYTTYKQRTGRDMVIYTTANWWNTCTGNWTGMRDKAPLWVAHWTTGSPTIPSGFPTWTAWQYTDKGNIGGISPVDRNKFNGSRDRLLALANNTTLANPKVDVD